MSAVIVLCGGKGERLRSVVSDRPKVLAEVGGRPFLAHVLHRLIDDGASEVFLSTGYRADMVAEFVRESGDWTVPVHCLAEPEPLGTAGALRYVCAEAALTETFFVLNGDTWFDGALGDLGAFHAEHRARLSIALVEVEDGSRYGQVRHDAQSGQVTSFEEKGQNAAPGWINAGLYRIEPSVIDLIPAGRKCSLEREIFPRLIGDGLYARGFDVASFLDIGTPEDFDRAQELLASRPDPNQETEGPA